MLSLVLHLGCFTCLILKWDCHGMAQNIHLKSVCFTIWWLFQRVLKVHSEYCCHTLEIQEKGWMGMPCSVDFNCICPQTRLLKCKDLVYFWKAGIYCTPVRVQIKSLSHLKLTWVEQDSHATQSKSSEFSVQFYSLSLVSISENKSKFYKLNYFCWAPQTHCYQYKYEQAL